MKLMVYSLLVTWIWDLGDCIFLITYVNGFCSYRYQHLKLYPEDESSPQSMKKLVVVESYNEIVFPEPSEVFLAYVQNHHVVNVPRLPAGLNLSSPSTFLSMLFLFLQVVVFKFFTLQIFSLSFPLFLFLQYQAIL